MPAPGARPGGLDRSSLVAVVRERLAVVERQAAVGVAVSGGPDSAGLARLVLDARPDLGVTLLHVRHGLRDDAPDAASAASMATLLGCPLVVRAVEVASTGGGPEAEARRARYAALAAMAADAGLVAVCVGHTAEDQAETVLLNLVRGAGLAGIGGMRHDRVVDGLRLLRPLLDLRRADVRAVAEEAGLPTVADPTNEDPEQRRARVRHEVMPVLARLAGGPGDPVGALTRLAALARDEDAVVGELVATAAEGLLRCWGPVVVADADAVAALPRAVGRRLVRAMAARSLPADAVEAVLDLDEGGRVSLPWDAAAVRSQGWLTIGPQDPPGLPVRAIAPDGAALPEIGLRLRPTGDPADASAAVDLPASRPAIGRHAEPQVRLPASAPDAAGWTVRSVTPGDEIRSGGRTRALADLLSDRGVPVALRPLVPVVIDSDGEVMWVPGVAAADGLPEEGTARLVLDRLPD